MALTTLPHLAISLRIKRTELLRIQYRRFKIIGIHFFAAGAILQDSRAFLVEPRDDIR